MHLEKEFDVKRPRARGRRARSRRTRRCSDLFPDTHDRDRRAQGASARTLASHYTALGREGTATFHFDFEPGGDVVLREGLRRPRLARAARAPCRFETQRQGTRVRIVMDGRTKALVPEFTIRGAMQEQIEQMATALRQRLERA